MLCTTGIQERISCLFTEDTVLINSVSRLRELSKRDPKGVLRVLFAKSAH